MSSLNPATFLQWGHANANYKLSGTEYSTFMLPSPPYVITLKNNRRGFPGGPVVNSLPCSAGGSGSIPGQGTKIPHPTGQLSLCATTTAPVYSRSHVLQLLSLPVARETARRKERFCRMQRRPHMPWLRLEACQMIIFFKIERKRNWQRSCLFVMKW